LPRQRRVWSEENTQELCSVRNERGRKYLDHLPEKLEGISRAAVKMKFCRINRNPNQQKQLRWLDTENDIIFEVRKRFNDEMGRAERRRFYDEALAELKRAGYVRKRAAVRKQWSSLETKSKPLTESESQAASSGPGPSESHAAKPAPGPAVQPAAAASPPGERPGATGEPE
jgi:hypothetical protein